MELIAGPNTGLGTWPARRARITPDRTALTDPRRSLTYAELAARTASCAGALRRLGVEQGDRVAYLGENAVEVFETLFATWLLGAIAVPLNHRWHGAEIRGALEDCGARVLVHSGEVEPLVRAARPLPDAVRHVLTVRHESGDTRGFDTEVDMGPAVEQEPSVGQDDPAILLYTSGTTGGPKGVVLTHGNLLWNTVNQLAHTDLLSTDRTLCIAPLFHCVGLCQLTLPTLFMGGTVEVLARFDPGFVLDRVGEGVTGFSAVPTMLQLMCEHPAWDSAELGSLRHVIYGGSLVPERVARAWLDRGVPLLQGYGMTEAAPGVYLSTEDGAVRRPTSPGTPHFFTDVATEQHGRVAPVDGTPRELLIRGPHVSTGYWNRAAETATRFGQDGWFRTGDVVRVDDDGWAHVVGRVDDMYISGGENVHPGEVEIHVCLMPEVAACAVVGVPDGRWGEVGVAYVELREGATLTEAAVRDHLATGLARFKLPKHVEFVPKLPRQATGKITRDVLRRLAVESHSAASGTS